MTFITWTCLRCVQELATILGPQNPTQRSCDVKAVVAAFNQEKALVGAFSVITNLRMDLCLNLYTLAASQHTTARVRTHYRNVKYEGQTYLLVLSHFEIKLTISFRILKHSMLAQCTNNKLHTSDEV